MAAGLYSRFLAWRGRRRLLRERRYLVREVQRICRLYHLNPEAELVGSLAVSSWGKFRHALKIAFTLGLWYLYRFFVRMQRRVLSSEAFTEIRNALDVFDQTLSRGREGRSIKALQGLDSVIGKHLKFARKSTIREYAESIGIAVFIALLLRAFVVEAFKIPSGSMIPTLEVGDHIFVNKFSYGLRIPFTKRPPRRFASWSRPKRGDVIVFINHKNPSIDFIKRVVAVGGDEVKVENGTIFLRRGGKGSWEAVPRKKISRQCTYKDLENGVWVDRNDCLYFQEELDGTRYLTVVHDKNVNKEYPPLDTYRTAAVPIGSLRIDGLLLFNPYRVPDGTVFVMGDNRTNSEDSRYPEGVGFVERDHIKGKALVVWASFGPSPRWWGMRFDRIGHVIR